MWKPVTRLRRRNLYETTCCNTDCSAGRFREESTYQNQSRKVKGETEGTGEKGEIRDKTSTSMEIFKRHNFWCLWGGRASVPTNLTLMFKLPRERLGKTMPSWRTRSLWATSKQNARAAPAVSRASSVTLLTEWQQQTKLWVHSIKFFQQIVWTNKGQASWHKTLKTKL